MTQFDGIETEFYKGGASLAEHLAHETQKILDETGSNIKLNLKKIQEDGSIEGLRKQDHIAEDQQGFMI